MGLCHLVYRLVVVIYCTIIIFVLPLLLIFPFPPHGREFSAMEGFRHMCVVLHYMSHVGVMLAFLVFCILYCRGIEDFLEFPSIIEGLLITYTILTIVTLLVTSLYSIVVGSLFMKKHVYYFQSSLYTYPLLELSLLGFMVLDCTTVFVYRDLI